MNKFLLFSTIVLGSLIVTHSGIFAQNTNKNDISLSISPAIVELALDPGEATTATTLFINNSPDPLAASIKAESLLPIDDVIDQSRRDEFDASSWITFDQENYAFDANDQKSIKFSINVPKNANPGGHYAQITLKPGIVQSISTTKQTKVLPQISASIFITVSGDVDELATIDSTRLNDLGFVTKDSATELSFDIENTGNVHILPAPRVTILSGGDVIETLSLQPQLILPNTRKTFTTEWSSSVPYGSYSLRAETVYGSSSTSLVSDSAQFTIIPSILQLLLASLLVPILVFALIKYRNVPKALSVLQGRAHFKGSHFKQPKNHQDHVHSETELADESVPEIAKELRSKSILGLPSTQDRDLVAELHASIAKNKKNAQKSKTNVQRPEIPSQSIVESPEGTTKVTQTSSSTIVRERPNMEEGKKDHADHVTVLKKHHPPKKAEPPKKSKKIIVQ